MSTKVQSVLLAILILGGIFASWSFGINQVAAAIEKAQAIQVQSVLEECVTYGAPHAVVADGVAYCYMVWKGSESLIPLETLKKLYSEPTPNPAPEPDSTST